MKTVIYLTGHAGSGKSTVAEELSDLLDSATIVEVDAIKVERYGSTEMCVPNDDFPEAGRQACLALKNHDRVIVVEAFGDDAHLDLVQGELPLDAVTLTILLKCDPVAAITRKQGVLSQQVVFGQLDRFSRGFPDRIVLDTTKATPEDVARQVNDLVGEVENSNT